MATTKVKQWASVDFSKPDSLYLEIKLKGHSKFTRFTVAQFTCSYSKNTIPTAQCMVAVGRLVRPKKYLFARIHTYADDLATMCEARVIANIQGEITPNGSKWPTTPLTLFEGYYIGLGHNQADSKSGVVLHLVHRSIDLAASSSVSAGVHQASPYQISARTVLSSGRATGAANAGAEFDSSQPVPFSNLSYSSALAGVQQDWWSSVKGMLTDIASVEGSIFETLAACPENAGDATLANNSRALRALSKVEGTGNGTGIPYRFGVPLELADPLPEAVAEQIRMFIGQQTVESWANSTLWDKLIGELLPMFKLSYIPRATTDLVIADMPNYYGTKPWRVLRVNDYENNSLQAIQDLPLRGIAVYGQTNSQALNDQILGSTEPGVLVAGCYLSDSVSAADGTVRYIPAPPWMNALWQSLTKIGDSRATEQGVRKGQRPADVYTQDAAAISNIFSRYAKTVYYDEVTKGNMATISGRLRFDIAPGSIVTLESRTDRFIKNGTFNREDSLAVDRVGQVSNVSIVINAEAKIASTSFAISSIRPFKEVSSKRTRVDEHPLFTKGSIHGNQTHGAPLLDEFGDISL
jgi:hypothetical protein